MGYRSVFITEDRPIIWPEWFIKRWNICVNVDNSYYPISSKYECKAYVTWTEIEEDIQKVLKEVDIDKLRIVYLHEDGEITKVEIHQNNKYYARPATWYISNTYGEKR